MRPRALWGRTTPFLLASACVAAVGGCSVLNSFDDVAPQNPPPDAGNGPPTPDGSAPVDSNAPMDTSPGVDNFVPTDTAVPDVGVDAGPRGVVVIGGSI